MGNPLGLRIVFGSTVSRDSNSLSSLGHRMLAESWSQDRLARTRVVRSSSSTQAWCAWLSGSTARYTCSTPGSQKLSPFIELPTRYAGREPCS